LLLAAELASVSALESLFSLLDPDIFLRLPFESFYHKYKEKKGIDMHHFQFKEKFIYIS